MLKTSSACAGLLIFVSAPCVCQCTPKPSNAIADVTTDVTTPAAWNSHEPINFIAGGLAIAVVIACGVIFQVRQTKREKQRAAELRLHWKNKFEQLADDLTPAPNRWSLDSILECLDEPAWAEIYEELKKMPAGKRSLQKAIAICDRDDYPRNA